MENGSYVYGESEFSVEDSFWKKKLLDFVNCLGYVGGVVPLKEVSKRYWKHLIYVSLLMGTRSHEGREGNNFFAITFNLLTITCILQRII